MSSLRVTGFVCGSIVAFASPPTLAATTPEEPISEIVVTATKRPSPLQTLAGNTAGQSREELEALAFDHPSEALNQLPGVNIHHNNGQEHLTAIRSPVLTGGAGAGSFLYMEDGIALRSPGFSNVNGLFGAHAELADRLEVVRGPGSALYGSNAVHGLVNVLTRNPLEQEKNTLDYFIGSHSQMAGKLSLAQKLDADAALGVNLSVKHDDGYRDATGYDQQKLTLRYDRKLAGGSVTAALSVYNLNQETAGFIQGFEAYKDSAIAKTNPNPEAYRDASALRGYVSWTREGDKGTLTLTPYFRATDMTFLMHFLPGQATEQNDHKSLGLQIRHDIEKSRNTLSYGLDLEHTKGNLTEIQDGPTVFSFVTGLHYDYDVTALQVSPYIHNEWHLSEKTKIVAGLRLDYTRYEYENNADVITVGRFQRIADRSDDFTTLTPKLGLNHQIAEEAALFVSYARGQRAPQTTDLYRLQINQEVADVEPELLDSIEVGLRDAIGPIRWEVTAYAMQKENFFFRDSDGFNVSDGKTDHVGIEVSASIPLSDQFDLAGTATYAKHTYAFDHPEDDIVDGNDVDTAPNWLANARLGWTPMEELRLELEWTYMGEYFTNGGNTATYDGHNIFNLRASYDVSEDLTLYARIENLADTAYAERADFAFGSHRYFPGEERSLFVGIRKTL
jgi:outer membrane receptor protein involved in Fe transport